MILEETCAGGEHATSRLAARALRASAAGASSVLDAGTGDGFLARVARGAGARRVVAVDRDPQAVELARRLAGIEVHAGDLLDASWGPFGVVVANLPDEVLFRVLPRLVEWTERVLIVTGVRLYRAAALLRALRRQGMAPQTPEALDGWCCITCLSPVCHPRA